MLLKSAFRARGESSSRIVEGHGARERLAARDDGGPDRPVGQQLPGLRRQAATPEVRLDDQATRPGVGSEQADLPAPVLGQGAYRPGAGEQAAQVADDRLRHIAHLEHNGLASRDPRDPGQPGAEPGGLVQQITVAPGHLAGDQRGTPGARLGGQDELGRERPARPPPFAAEPGPAGGIEWHQPRIGRAACSNTRRHVYQYIDAYVEDQRLRLNIDVTDELGLTAGPSAVPLSYVYR
jgi:hypothetical protein